MEGLKSLFQSRKFYIALFALIQSVVLHYFQVPEEIWQGINGLAMVLIAGIAIEDAGEKAGGVRFEDAGDEGEGVE